MPQQHEVAISDNRGQDVVEIMRNTARQLPDRFHLRLLGELPLQGYLFAIILKSKQNRSATKPAHASDGERNDFIGSLFQANGDVA